MYVSKKCFPFLNSGIVLSMFYQIVSRIEKQYSKKIRKKKYLIFITLKREIKDLSFKLRLISWLSFFLITVSAIYGTISIRLKRHLGVYSALRALDIEHLAWFVIISSITHFNSRLFFYIIIPTKIRRSFTTVQT